MNNICIGVVGLGYVGLPLAVEFGKKFPVLGFDINQARKGQSTHGLHLSAMAEYGSWLLGVEYSDADINGPVDHDITGYQALTAQFGASPPWANFDLYDHNNPMLQTTVTAPGGISDFMQYWKTNVQLASMTSGCTSPQSHPAAEPM